MVFPIQSGCQVKKKEMKKKESHLQGQVGRQKYFSNH